MKKQADYIYYVADEIVAVSRTYVERALSINKKCNKGHIVFLGTELQYFDRLAEENRKIRKSRDSIWIVYIGTLGNSYDLICVIDALKLIKNKVQLKLIIIGDGPLKADFMNYAKKCELNFEFTGRLDYDKMVGILVDCDIAVNPIVKGSAGSIINKVCDYAAAGLPVVNTQECKEYRELLDKYNAGYNCNIGDPDDMSKRILKLCDDAMLRIEMGANNRKLFEEKFNREDTYLTIQNILLRRE
jgi:glycosyltransferase involved in cell wall biosynthesis